MLLDYHLIMLQYMYIAIGGDKMIYIDFDGVITAHINKSSLSKQ